MWITKSVYHHLFWILSISARLYTTHINRLYNGAFSFAGSNPSSSAWWKWIYKNLAVNLTLVQKYVCFRSDYQISKYSYLQPRRKFFDEINVTYILQPLTCAILKPPRKTHKSYPSVIYFHAETVRCVALQLHLPSHHHNRYTIFLLFVLCVPFVLIAH